MDGLHSLSLQRPWSGASRSTHDRTWGGGTPPSFCPYRRRGRGGPMSSWKEPLLCNPPRIMGGVVKRPRPNEGRNGSGEGRRGKRSGRTIFCDSLRLRKVNPVSWKRAREREVEWVKEASFRGLQGHVAFSHFKSRDRFKDGVLGIEF